MESTHMVEESPETCMAEEAQRLMCMFGLSPGGMWHPDTSDGTLTSRAAWFFVGGQLLSPDLKRPRAARPNAGGSTLSSSRMRSSDYQYTHRMSRSRAKPYDKAAAKMAVEEDVKEVPMEVDLARNEAYPICS